MRSFSTITTLTALTIFASILLASDALASDGGQCMLLSSDSLLEVRRGGGEGDGGLLDQIMKMILRVVNEMMHLMVRIVCAIINEFGVRCR